MIRLAATFEEYIAVLAAESPTALVLGEWRRLDHGVRQHFRLARGREAKGHDELEQHIAEYPNLGPIVSSQIAALRRHRNVVAHEDFSSLSPDEAMSFARQIHSATNQLIKYWPA